MPSDRNEAFAAGASGFLGKPFTAAELLAEISKQLNGRNQQAA
jgi:CheY-like chemotaxis protein